MYSKILRVSFCFAFFCFLVSCSEEENLDSSENISKVSLVLDYDYNSIEIETLTLINNYRVSKGLNILQRINHVSYKSKEHVDYMIANNVVNHNDFDTRSSNIMKALGAKTVSENIAYNYNSAKGAFDAWLKSDSHRVNMEGDYTHFGISIRENPSNGKKYYTNIFVKI